MEQQSGCQRLRPGAELRMSHGQYASGLAQADVAPVDEGPGGRACCRFLCPMHGENDGRSSRCSGCRRGNRGISVQGSRSNPFVAGIRGIVSSIAAHPGLVRRSRHYSEWARIAIPGAVRLCTNRTELAERRPIGYSFADGSEDCYARMYATSIERGPLVYVRP